MTLLLQTVDLSHFSLKKRSSNLRAKFTRVQEASSEQLPEEKRLDDELLLLNDFVIVGVTLQERGVQSRFSPSR